MITFGFIIACPVGYYATNKWQENFAYKTALSWLTLVLSGILTLGIALLTVSFQSWRAAIRNPNSSGWRSKVLMTKIYTLFVKNFDTIPIPLQRK